MPLEETFYGVKKIGQGSVPFFFTTNKQEAEDTARRYNKVHGSGYIMLAYDEGRLKNLLKGLIKARQNLEDNIDMVSQLLDKPRV